MESGVVSVDGPRPSDTVMLRAGQSLSLRAEAPRALSMAMAQPRGPRTRAPRFRPGSRARRYEPPAPESHAVARLRRATQRARPTADAASQRARWSERLADGDAAGIVAEAQRRGIINVLATASSEDLAALADAARFRGQDHLARRVLLAQRGRFPGTLRAEEASFLLGRLADGPGGRSADALAWYDRYLHEAPSGGYSAEAMGRMMIVLERQQRIDEARAVATAYLRRFPQGVYARAARAVTSPDR